MTKRTSQKVDEGAEQPAPRPAETPGILASSMTDVRGYRLGPTGTALGVGGSRPGPPPEDVRSADVDPTTFARLQAMVGRLDEAPRRAIGSDIASPAEAAPTPSPVATEAASGTALTREAEAPHEVLAPVAGLPPQRFRWRPLALLSLIAVAAIALWTYRRPSAPPASALGGTPPLVVSSAPEPQAARPATLPMQSAASSNGVEPSVRDASNERSASTRRSSPAPVASAPGRSPSVEPLPQPQTPPPPSRDLERVDSPFNARPSNPPE